MNKITTLMIETAYQALKNSHSPYSNFAVASCICTNDDTLYTGVNVENSSYPVSICAEVGAIANMVNGGHKQIKSMVILASNNKICPPCGACRQCIQEFSIPDTTILLCDQYSVLHSTTINELLPHAFVFNSLPGLIHD